MRDSFGGIFMFRLMIVFIFIFVTFTAVSLNYAKAFRIKNGIIDFIEQEEIYSLDTLFKSASPNKLSKLNAILDNANYNKECQKVDSNGKLKRDQGDKVAYCYRGIIIEEEGVVNKTIVYNVYTYASWNLGALNMILALGGQSPNSENVVDGTWEIKGEARVSARNRG